MLFPTLADLVAPPAADAAPDADAAEVDDADPAKEPSSGRRHFFLCSFSCVGTITSRSSHRSSGSSWHSWYSSVWHLVETTGRQSVVWRTSQVILG